MTATSTELITAPGGGTFDGYLVLPDAGSGPGILLLQEIFGVGSYLRAVGERLAAMGYVVLMPDAFWRIERGVALDHDQAGLEAGLALMGRYAEQWEQGLSDLEAAYDHLEAMAAVRGGVGVMGFCLGGRLAWHLAARRRPRAGICYYPSGVAEALDEAKAIECPLLIHVGDADVYMPAPALEALRSGVEDKDNVELHVHPGAGHAFDNHDAPMFHQPEPAAAAWEQTVAFLARRLPPG